MGQGHGGVDCCCWCLLSQQSLTRARLDRPRIRTVRLPVADGEKAQASAPYARQPQEPRCLQEGLGDGGKGPDGSRDVLNGLYK